MKAQYYDDEVDSMHVGLQRLVSRRMKHGLCRVVPRPSEPEPQPEPEPKQRADSGWPCKRCGFYFEASILIPTDTIACPKCGLENDVPEFSDDEPGPPTLNLGANVLEQALPLEDRPGLDEPVAHDWDDDSDVDLEDEPDANEQPET